MGEMYNHAEMDHLHAPLDEISIFVHQFLLRSSSLPSCSPVVGPHSPHGETIPTESVIMRDSEVHASSTLLRVASDNHNSTLPCNGESKKEAPSPAPPRTSSSKRSRSAEVHNLSEKRRRRRINEKMKALQKLIPDSNKTDKASMLDEAIEYLKQLQLQVQMLSMRNRISLHSIFLPEPLQPSNNFQSRFDPVEGKPSQNLSSIGGSLAINQDSRPQRMSNPRKQCTVSNQLFVPDLSNILDWKASCGSDASFHAQVEGFLLHKSAGLSSVVTPMGNYATGDREIVATLSQCSSKEVHKADVLPHEYFDNSHSARTLSELGIEAIFTSSLPSEKCAYNMKDCSQEASLTGRGQKYVPLENTKGNHAHFKDLDMLITPSYATKRERRAS